MVGRPSSIRQTATTASAQETTAIAAATRARPTPAVGSTLMMGGTLEASDGSSDRFRGVSG